MRGTAADCKRQEPDLGTLRPWQAGWYGLQRSQWCSDRASTGAERRARLVDLHVWRVGKAVYACALSVLGRDAALTPAELRARIAEHEEVVHSTVDMIRR